LVDVTSSVYPGALQGGSGWARFATYDTESGKIFFVKTATRNAEMFIGEGAGLKAMHATNTLVVPKVC
jgi:fructosamine-3-kinase